MTSHNVAGMTQTTAATAAEVTLERRGPALWIRIDRPDALNALNQAVVEGIAHNAYAQSKIDATAAELVTEREAVAELLG